MTEVNYELLSQLADKPHPLLNIADDLEAQVRETPIAWTGEVFITARTAHHLLDLAGIPQRDPEHVYASDLDARTWLAVNALIEARGQLDRISGRHRRLTGPSRTADGSCGECGQLWPCDTRRMADGTYKDPA